MNSSRSMKALARCRVAIRPSKHVVRSMSTTCAVPQTASTSATTRRVNLLAMGPRQRRLEATAAIYQQRQDEQQQQQQLEEQSDLVVVLDMDECLIHSQFLSPQAARLAHQKPANWKANRGITKVESFRVTLPNGAVVHVNKRPHLHEFLEAVSSRFETHIFTAAVPVYADLVLDHLDPHRTMFAQRWYRADCDFVLGSHYVKDLDRLKKNIKRIVLVDNNSDSFKANPENGILVPSFTNDANDSSLLDVLNLLDELDEQEDVRPTLETKFGLRKN